MRVAPSRSDLKVTIKHYEVGRELVSLKLEVGAKVLRIRCIKIQKQLLGAHERREPCGANRRSILPRARDPAKDVAVECHMADGRERQVSGHE
jgi:hypothetical protein